LGLWPLTNEMTQAIISLYLNPESRELRTTQKLKTQEKVSKGVGLKPHVLKQYFPRRKLRCKIRNFLHVVGFQCI